MPFLHYRAGLIIEVCDLYHTYIVSVIPRRHLPYLQQIPEVAIHFVEPETEGMTLLSRKFYYICDGTERADGVTLDSVD